jgi:two-component system sensor histidine kinase RpfC
MNGFFNSPSASVATSDAPGFASRARAFFAARPDREHEIAFNRLAMCFVGLSVLASARIFGFLEWTHRAFWLDGYLIVYSFGLFAHLMRWPGVSIARRVIGIFCDLLAICVPMYFGGAAVAGMFPLLLWAIFGNGFRFGVRYLFLATAISVALFSAIVLTTPFWTENMSLSVGLLLGLVILPLYTSVLIRQLSEAKRLAEEANKAKTLFLASVSHELRTPLNAIIGLSDMLTDSRLDEEHTDMSRVIGRSGRSLLSLINSILEISRMECGYPNMKVDEVDLYRLMDDLHGMLAVQARAKNLDFGLHIRPGAPRHVASNARHIEEIIVNLAGNAIKFTQSGFVTITVDGARTADGKVNARFEVTDTGIGIAPEATSRIFDRFAQADETIIDRFGGTGLGLAIAKQLVEGMGGSIGVDSVVGAGSTFWFEIVADQPERSEDLDCDVEISLLSRDEALAATLSSVASLTRRHDDEESLVRALKGCPESARGRAVIVIDARGGASDPTEGIRRLRASLAESDARFVCVFDQARASLPRDMECLLSTCLFDPVDVDAARRALTIASIHRLRREGAKPAGARIEGASLNVLVAEDNRTNQLVIHKILERAGHAVTIVEDGQAALEKLSEGAFDLALMDVNMPVMNGVDAARLYQFVGPPETRTPIAALTADATPDAERRCLDAGMIACITKPVEARQLVAWLDAFARDRAPRAPEMESVEPLAETETSAGDAQAIDDGALNDLKSLGGDEFVSEIVDQFLADAANVLKSLHVAVADGDVQKFRDEAHALRSCAANVGAQKVYKLCLEWRAIDARELAIEGEIRIRRLEQEFEHAREALAMFRRSEGGF